MKILFLPDYGDNVYQKNLKEELLKLNIEVFPALRVSFFPILRSCFKYKTKTLHIHWTNPYLLARNTFFSLIKSSLFLFELYIIKLLGIKIIWTIHNLHNHEKIQYNIEFFFNKKISKISNYFIVHSEFHKKEFIRFFKIKNPEKIFIIYEGNYISYYKNEISKEKAREKLNLKNEKIILFFGNIRKYKGVLEFIEIFKTIKDISLRFLIVGKAYDEKIKEEILKSIENDKRIITEIKFIEDDDIQIYMNASDLLILPYIEITNSAVLILAMSFAKAIMFKENEYIKEILKENAIFYDENIKDLKEKIQNINIKELEEIGHKNYEKIKKHTWEENAKRTLSLYKKI